MTKEKIVAKVKSKKCIVRNDRNGDIVADKIFMAYIECRVNGKYIWSETSGIWRLTKRMAQEDANRVMGEQRQATGVTYIPIVIV